jgi:citrate lyase subunit alpha/citrate CoA-transferase
MLRGRIACVVPKVTTLTTPGKGVDVVVTEYGIAVNPARPEIAERLAAAGLKIVDIKDLAAKATSIIGTPDPLPFGDRVVGVVMSRHGEILDRIHNIVE